ncbi:glucose 1-dehydrogenase [Legionella lytica]|uniref:Glucose 1-dehydrogenase n=1 Tax=Legionella lytica TaxID=96232 RepID=A0ABY4Y9I0_9GAMM|nr:glucose 1-dehydrogenase [Legionella lytica]USQ14176.1 glucose 1-dehydrogenase [Legionella lytica]
MNKQVVLITGALAGIGRATAFAFAREGAKLIISGRRQEEGDSLAKELSALGAEAEFVRADVRNEGDVKALVEQAIKRFGRLDVAVNNAGIEGEQTPIVESTVESFHMVFDTNVVGVLFCLKYELQAMIPQGSGSIINISSVAGKKGFPGASIYCASKHAVDGLTKVAALEAAGANVRVNAVAPGPVATAMFERFAATDEVKDVLINQVPLKRLGRPDEIAKTIVFLVSDQAPYITGQFIGVDGGLMA